MMVKTCTETGNILRRNLKISMSSSGIIAGLRAQKHGCKSFLPNIPKNNLISSEMSEEKCSNSARSVSTKIDFLFFYRS